MVEIDDGIRQVGKRFDNEMSARLEFGAGVSPSSHCTYGHSCCQPHLHVEYGIANDECLRRKDSELVCCLEGTIWGRFRPPSVVSSDEGAEIGEHMEWFEDTLQADERLSRYDPEGHSLPSERFDNSSGVRKEWGSCQAIGMIEISVGLDTAIGDVILQVRGQVREHRSKGEPDHGSHLFWCRVDREDLFRCAPKTVDEKGY